MTGLTSLEPESPQQKLAAADAAKLRQLLGMSRTARRKRGARATRAELERYLAVEERKAAA